MRKPREFGERTRMHLEFDALRLSTLDGTPVALREYVRDRLLVVCLRHLA